MTGASARGALARRLLLAVLVVPVAMEVLHLAGEKAGLYSAGFGHALAVLVTSVVFAAVIWRGARALDRSERELRRANRALKTLGDTNSALVRAVSESELLATVCRVIVESGGYRMAWVGYAVDDAAKSVRPVAQAGFEESYLDGLQISWDDTEYGRGPVGTAIRTGQVVVANDILRDPAFLPWRARAAARGYASLIGLPLLAGEQTLGALSIYSPEPDAFDAAEARLLAQLAGDLAYGITALRTRAAHERLLAEVRRSNAELEQRVAERTSEIARANADLQAEIAERARLEQQIRRDAARANALADLSQALSETSLEYQPLFETIARRISELVGDTCVVSLLSEDQQWLRTVALYHPDPEGRAFIGALTASEPHPADGGLAGRVVHSGQALLLPAMSQAQIRAEIEPEFQSYLDRVGMSSLLIVPLRARGRILGTLGVSRDRPGQPYTLDDQSLLQDLADRAGMALEKARLLAEVRRAQAAAERANQAKTNFLRSTSHELRTPLNAIIGFTGMLLMRLPGPLTPDQESQLHTNPRSSVLSTAKSAKDAKKIKKP